MMVSVVESKIFLDEDHSVTLVKGFLSSKDSQTLLKASLKLPWQSRSTVLIGKIVNLHRQFALVGCRRRTKTSKPLTYTYRNKASIVKKWPSAIQRAAERIESYFNGKALFNSCFSSLYNLETDHMAKHCDATTELEPDSLIVSLSLGATRSFIIREIKQHEPVIEKPDRASRIGNRQNAVLQVAAKDNATKIDLENGDMFVMTTQMQKSYTHEVPEGKGLRICLNFRMLKETKEGEK
jgi:alkylated DNA repair dioxygenase AlkB